MNFILRLATALFVIQVSTPVHSQTIDNIVRNEDSFWSLRTATKMIDISLVRYLVQLQIDDARLDYLRSIDSPQYIFVRFELDSLRSAELGQGLLAELSASRIPNKLVSKAIIDIWTVVQRDGICDEGRKCIYGSETDSGVDSVINSIFPDLIEPNSGFPEWARSTYMHNCLELVARELGSSEGNVICECSLSGFSEEFEPEQVVRVSELFEHGDVPGAKRELRQSSSPSDLDLLDRFDRVEPILESCLR